MKSDATDGPFIYRSARPYDKEYLVLDVWLLSLRVALTFISMILYCPDYFEYFIGNFD